MTRSTYDDLSTRFRYHPLTGQAQAALYERIRGHLHASAEWLCEVVPESREQDLMVTRLEEALMWAIAGVGRRGTSPSTTPPPDRTPAPAPTVSHAAAPVPDEGTRTQGPAPQQRVSVRLEILTGDDEDPAEPPEVLSGQPPHPQNCGCRGHRRPVATPPQPGPDPEAERRERWLDAALRESAACEPSEEPGWCRTHGEPYGSSGETDGQCEYVQKMLRVAEAAAREACRIERRAARHAYVTGRLGTFLCQDGGLDRE